MAGAARGFIFARRALNGHSDWPIDLLMDLLDIRGLESVDRLIDNNKRQYRIFAEIIDPQNFCPACGSQELHRLGHRKRVYGDSPLRDYRVLLEIQVQRYRCLKCLFVFLHDVPGIDPLHRMTLRCVRYIRDRGMRHTFAHVAELIGCNEKTIRNICKEFMWQINEVEIPYMPDWLGMDETHIRGKYRCVLADIGRGQVIDILENKKDLTIAKWLFEQDARYKREERKHSKERGEPETRKEQSKLKGVTMDMTGNFRKLIRNQFPDVPIVVDKYHVLSKANDAVDIVRNRLQAGKNKKTRTWWNNNKGLLRSRKIPHNPKVYKEAKFKLDNWLANEPELATVYQLKQKFFAIYYLSNKKDAERAMDDWYEEVQKTNMEEPFADLVSVLYGKKKKPPKKPPKKPRKEPETWKKEILAYFDYPDKTNAFCESLNNLAKTLNRAGRGYDFTTLRARVLYATKPAVPEPYRKPTKDFEEQHRHKTLIDVGRMYDALLARYGDLCSRCCGVFEKNLHRYLRTVSQWDYSLAEKKFYLRCESCGRKYTILAMSPLSVGSDYQKVQLLRAALQDRLERLNKRENAAKTLGSTAPMTSIVRRLLALEYSGSVDVRR